MFYLMIFLMFIIVWFSIVICRIKKRKSKWSILVLSNGVICLFLYNYFFVLYEIRELFLSISLPLFICLIISMVLIIFKDEEK
ncbi:MULTISPECIES: hypothetical protein [Clostridium]|uniref:hypothetical protein n=1 Tax=Clostridium TaxID=1485 RepID=UPI00232DC559|nr:MULTISPECIES: hypothetical protein [Clostridium]MDB2104823.1 hypothetical protein [Clostridium paraputrificum]MDU2108711.1 hypothetical protein [Clostridium sp.]MDU3355178.1 hypothetical protein [Clostridium sp.]MDU4727964.1 hypothetical protein [Clostridium sp.]